MKRTAPAAGRTAWRALVGAVAAWRRRWRQREALPALDDRTLRDLGLDRSEWRSVLAESAGDAAPTRRRVALRPRSAEPGTTVRATWVPRPWRRRWSAAAATLLAAVSLIGCGGRRQPDAAEAVVRGAVGVAAAGSQAAGGVDRPGRSAPPSGPNEPRPARC